MTTPGAAADLLRTHFNTNWATTGAVGSWDHATQTAWDNKQFTPPQSEWVAFFVEGPTDSFRAEIGAPFFRQTIELNVNIYSPPDVDSQRHEDLIDAMLELFQLSPPEVLRNRGANFDRVGVDETGFFRTNGVFILEVDHLWS